jgi:hypothetical protein
MSFWIFLWKAVLILGLLVFTGMAVWVAIGGYRDIKKMLSQVNSDQENKET